MNQEEQRAAEKPKRINGEAASDAEFFFPLFL
jgi:hypothetical protein